MSTYLRSFLETHVITAYAYHTTICNGMHTLNKENTQWEPKFVLITIYT